MIVGVIRDSGIFSSVPTAPIRPRMVTDDNGAGQPINLHGASCGAPAAGQSRELSACDIHACVMSPQRPTGSPQAHFRRSCERSSG